MPDRCCFGVESLGQPGDFRLGQEALDLAHRRLLDAARRVVGAQAALDCERENCADKRDALRRGALAAGRDAARPPLVAVPDLLGRLAGRNGVAHPLDIGANDAISPQFAEQRSQVMLDASAIGLEGRGLLVAHALAQIEIDQLAEGQRLAIFLARRRRIAAGGNLGEQALCLGARRLRRPRRTMLADGQPPLRRAAARTCPVIDRIGLGARWRDDKHEALHVGVPDKVGGVPCLGAVDNSLGDLCPHRAISRPRRVGTMSAPEIVVVTANVGFWREKSKEFCGVWCRHGVCGGA